MYMYPSGCGVHIHSGTSCLNTTLQGGHYYEDLVLEDPWTEKRYTSFEKASGVNAGTFRGILEIGTTDVEGRAFVGK
jgi:hypothetical protein